MEEKTQEDTAISKYPNNYSYESSIDDTIIEANNIGTILLDALARRKTTGKVEGNLYLNNEALMTDFERITGYCEQMDIHQPAVSVREALRFSAYLPQPANVPKEEKGCLR